MKVYVLDEVLEYENSNIKIDAMFEEIDRIISGSPHTYSHIEIDGVIVYENIYDYFSGNIKNIKEVKVKTKKISEFVKDIIGTTADYFERAIPEIELMADEFYKTPTQQSWESLKDLTHGIQWIMDSYAAVDKSNAMENSFKNQDTWKLYAKDISGLKNLLQTLGHHLKQKNLTSLADIFSYDLIPLFRQMKEKLVVLEYPNLN